MRLLASLHYKSVKLPKWNQSQKSLVDFNVDKKNTAGFASYAVQEVKQPKLFAG